MRRSVVVAVCTVLMLVGSAVAAFAGEVNGRGEPTPIRERAGSICAFSGLNDDPDQPEMFEGGRVQSFGDIVQEFVQVVDDRGASTFHEMIVAEGPGVSCRGYASQG
jgi:hypothetical protein